MSVTRGPWYTCQAAKKFHTQTLTILRFDYVKYQDTLYLDNKLYTFTYINKENMASIPLMCNAVL